jgi:16S rRNA (cytidine1402-2'-O)-methyltransferase
MNKYGKLTLGAVPIGDFKDSSFNLIDYIINHKIILVETLLPFYDLCKNLNISTNAQIIEYGNYDSDEKINQYITFLKNGENILFLSDEGTAGIIDPGGKLLRVARQENIPIKVMAGPNSIIPSVVLAQYDFKFYFHGPAPDKENRRKAFSELCNLSVPTIFFVTNDYMNDFLLDAIEFFGKDRNVSICSNLTKPNEFIKYTTVFGLFEYFYSGEMNTSITLTIEGKSPHHQ